MLPQLDELVIILGYFCHFQLLNFRFCMNGFMFTGRELFVIIHTFSRYEWLGRDIENYNDNACWVLYPLQFTLEGEMNNKPCWKHYYLWLSTYQIPCICCLKKNTIIQLFDWEDYQPIQVHHSNMTKSNMATLMRRKASGPISYFRI